MGWLGKNERESQAPPTPLNDKGTPRLPARFLLTGSQEYALKAVDVLARRTRLAYIDSKAALDAAPRVIEIMSGLLGWSRSRRKQEMREVMYTHVYVGRDGT